MEKNNSRLRTFNGLALFAILTQVANPILMYCETETDWYPGIPWYKQEANLFYYLRNSLTTVGDLILQTYCVVFMVRLNRGLTRLREPSLGRIKVRISFLGAIIEVFLITTLLMVWFQNLWWYEASNELWVAC